MKRGHILVADRDVELLEGMRILLEPVAESVLMAADATSFAHAVRRLRPELAIVGLSLKVDGEINVARYLRRQHPELKFILLSGQRHPSIVREALSAGASGFVLRQTVDSDLLTAVREVRQGRRFLSPTDDPLQWAATILSPSIH